MKKQETMQLDPRLHPADAKVYLGRLPGYFPLGLREGATPLATLYLAHADQVEFYLRRYIAGEEALPRLFTQIKDFLAVDDVAARQMIAFSLKTVGDYLLLREWYEYIPRLQTACTKIEKTFRIQPVTTTNDGKSN